LSTTETVYEAPVEALKARGANPCATVLPSAWMTAQLPVIGSPAIEAEVTLTKKVAVAVVELTVVAELVELVELVVVLVELVVVAELVELLAVEVMVDVVVVVDVVEVEAVVEFVDVVDAVEVVVVELVVEELAAAVARALATTAR
jgi:hypothetical protein